MEDLKLITAEVKTLLDALRDGGNPVFKEVLTEAKTEVSGYPYAYVYNVDSEADFATSNHNEREYTFQVLMVTNGAELADWDRIRELQDLVANAIDTSNDLNGVGGIVYPTTIEDLDSVTDGAGEHIAGTLQFIAKKLIAI